jgi:indole-3-glycerol phosphate synthase
MDFLSQAVKQKQAELRAAKRKLPLKQMIGLAVRVKDRIDRCSFKQALLKKPIALIAEIKLKSPTAGKLTQRNFTQLAKIYGQSRVDAISVLTDKKYFGGSLKFLHQARGLCPQPILRKDFIIDEYQLYESRLLGADAILLIAALLNVARLKKFLALAKNLGLACLVEVHSAAEARKAISADAEIIGINNRDLKSLAVNLIITARLKEFMPKGKIIVSESGINSAKDVRFMLNSGVHAILVGSCIAAAKDPGEKINELKSIL